MSTDRSRPARPASLAGLLLKWLLIPVSILLLLAVGLSVLLASRAVDQLFDQQMENGSQLLSAFLLYEQSEYDDDDDDDDDDKDENDEEDDDSVTNASGLSGDATFAPGRGADDDWNEELAEVVAAIEAQYDLQVDYRVRVAGKLLFTSTRLRGLPACAEGFSNIDATADERLQLPADPQPASRTKSQPARSGNAESIRHWRCYRSLPLASTAADASGIKPPQVDIEIFMPLRERSQATRQLILATFLPLLVLPALIVISVLLGVKRAMRPVRELSSSVQARSLNYLAPVETAEPTRELQPVVASINRLLQRLERGIQREKQFSDDAAHELRTPVTSISMLEQLLRRENRDVALEPYLDDLQAVTRQSSELIDQLLKFARLQAAAEMPVESVDLLDLVRTQLGDLSTLIISRSLSVVIEPESARLILNGNCEALTLMLNNLLVNAFKFSPREGTVYLLVGSDTLSIEDQGCGIAESEREKVFDRFYRSHGTGSTPGSGLGLALAKWVAEVHGLDLAVVDPVMGTGACLRIALPDSQYQQVELP